MDREVLTAPEASKRCLDGHVADVAMSEERRRNQYLADVTQESEERQRRNVGTLDPDAQETRDRWNATQVTTHERSFPFSDNLTTLMFIVASDLSEAQRETHKFPCSQGNECHRLHP